MGKSIRVGVLPVVPSQGLGIGSEKDTRFLTLFFRKFSHMYGVGTVLQ